MGRTQLRKSGIRGLFMNNIERVAKALIATLIVGIVLLFLWIFLSGFLVSTPQYIWLFSVLIWGTLLFTFTRNVTAGTVYQYALNIARAFFFIFAISYGTNFGSLRLGLPGGFVTAQFVPILALVVFICILDVGRSVLQIIQLKSYSPID
jgi:hypothetical protein